MEKDQFKDLLQRYEKDELTAAEKMMLENWYASYENDNFDGFYDAEHQTRIKTEMKTVIMSQPHLKRNRLLIWRSTYIYAAIIAFSIPAILIFSHHTSSIYTKAAKTEFMVFTTSATENKVLTLQDNSIVHLNPSSVFKVTAHFGTLPERHVFLEKGNAFFEVAKDRRHPFIVHAQELTTRVLGTKFMVRNAVGHTTEVSVSEGKVQIALHKKVLAVLLPGKKITYDKNKKHWEKSDFGISENNAWYKSVINLNQATFAEVADAVKINYGVDLISRHPNTAHYRFNLQIRSERSLDQTLKMICSVHQNNYRRNKNGIVIY